MSGEWGIAAKEHIGRKRSGFVADRLQMLNGLLTIPVLSFYFRITLCVLCALLWPTTESSFILPRAEGLFAAFILNAMFALRLRRLVY